MTLEQLRIFVAVARYQHVTLGARDLNLTQSAVSAAIATLENQHQALLFHRIGRRIELTDVGLVFLEEAKAVLARAEAAGRVLDDLTQLRRGALVLAASQTVGNYWLPELMRQFRRNHPMIRLTIRLSNTSLVTKAILAGEADLGFVEGQVDEDMLKVTMVDHDDLVLVVAASHPWAGMPPVTAEDFLASGWILREPGSGTRAMSEAALTARGIPLERLSVQLELPTNEAVISALMAGRDCAFVSAFAAHLALKAGTLVKLDVSLPRRAFLMLQHRQRYSSRAARTFISLLGPQPEPG